DSDSRRHDLAQRQSFQSSAKFERAVLLVRGVLEENADDQQPDSGDDMNRNQTEQAEPHQYQRESGTHAGRRPSGSSQVRMTTPEVRSKNPSTVQRKARNQVESGQ